MKVAIRLLFIILAIFITIYGLGEVTTILRKQYANNKHEVFKSGTTYIEGSNEFIANSYYEYNKTTDEIERKAICNYLINKYPNLDTNTIENNLLVNFYNSCFYGGN